MIDYNRSGQMKSKERVANYGEVFTNEREVNAMLDLVKQETERIDSRFLEPACGEGAFLKEILRRKLEVVKRMYDKSPYDYERYAILALTSIYGIDIMADNVEICRQNLFDIWNEEYSQNADEYANDQCREIAEFILRKNIICGDTLTLLQDDNLPITFAEWSFDIGDNFKRRDYQLSDMLDEHPIPVREYPPTDYRRLNIYE